jgi:hypothetical protein
MTATDALRPAVALLAEIVSAFPDLPAPAVVLHQQAEFGISLQLERGCDLEAWREALGVPPELLVLHVYASVVWAEATALVGGVRVQLYSDLPVAPALAAVSPLLDAERRRSAALVEQRHQVEDAAVPPLAVADPARDFAASMAAGFVQVPQWSDPAPTRQPDTVAGAFRAVMRGDA